ncbi:MAG: hypothetical protein LAT64_13680 [Phycisphaerales bacterium]|nr:hypothetical protein [Planctomycetota bacterium]MCH8509802.1 hypothetical protein [Phycisphaerales bacterium]
MRTGWMAVLLAVFTVCGLVRGADGPGTAYPFGVGGGSPGTGWFVPTPGFRTAVEDGVLRLEPDPDAGEARAGFGNVMRQIAEMDGLRGVRVALTARVRVVGGVGRAQMWLRVDRPDGRRGAFDNMGHDPVLPGDWRAVRIEADIHADAESLNIGFMSVGGASVLVDSVRVEVIGDGRPLQEASRPVVLDERALAHAEAAARLFAVVWLFEPSDAARDTKAWAHLAVDAMGAALDAGDAASLAGALGDVFAPVSPGLRVWAGAQDDAGPVPAVAEGATLGRFWKHRGAGRALTPGTPNVYSSYLDAVVLDAEEVGRQRSEAFWVGELAEGVWCRVPLWADLARGRSVPASADAGRYADPGVLPELTATNHLTRLAGVAMAWGVPEHFYPYFDVVDADWDAALRDALADAAGADGPAAYARALRRMIARLEDGHGRVEWQGGSAGTYLPVRPAWAGDELVVVGVAEAARGEIAVGDAIVSIDGRTADELLDRAREEISGATDGWVRHQSGAWLVFDLETADQFTMVVRGADGEERAVLVSRSSSFAPDERGAPPENGVELAPGIVYFNLNGTEEAELAAHLDMLAAAEGIVFDLRGYPDSAAYALMAHLTDEPVRSAHWMIPEVTRPGREGWSWAEPGRWLIQPRAPRIGAETVFLISEGAISYAESILGIVEHEGMGTLVGTRTAGTNGNVHQIDLPDGFWVAWTGMKVLKHDGSRHHGVGIAPHVEVHPTAAGIAAGRDEVLEAGVRVLVQRLAGVGGGIMP